MSKIVGGIDLGTTNSTISVVNSEGKIVLIKGDDGYITRSAVYFGEKEPIVGEKAKQLAADDPDNVVLLVKREMGKDKNNVRMKFRKSHPYEFGDKIYSPEDISSYILAKLKSDAEHQLGKELKDVIITCPAYFGDKEKNATKSAGELAGFNVLEIIQEPVAASISYSSRANKENETVFVFDLGGGTFDVTVLEIKDKNVKQLATDGDHHLGGVDWDELIERDILNTFSNKYGEDVDKLYTKDAKKSIGKLKLDIEKAKVELFNDQDSNKKVKISFEYNNKIVDKDIDKDEFAKLTEIQDDKCIDKCKSTLEEAGKTVSDIDTVLMIGSMSRCKTVQNKLEEFFGRKITQIVNPKTCVSEGAAIKAANIEKISTQVPEEVGQFDDFNQDEKKIKDAEKKQETGNWKKFDFDRQIKTIMSRTIGIKGTKNNKECAKVIIEKGCQYPCENCYENEFAIAAEASEIIFIESTKAEKLNGIIDKDEANWSELGSLKLGSKKMVFDKIRIKISIDQSGILNVVAFNEEEGFRVEGNISDDFKIC